MLRLLLWTTLLAAGVTSYYTGLPTRTRLVRTKEGPVRGYLERSASGKAFFAFRGIPYARPPVGELRFQPPQRHPGWKRPLDAKEHGSVCPQIDTFSETPLIGNEDCLFVNVYTRQVRTRMQSVSSQPVMIFVHGGMYIRGSGNDRYYGPKYLMDEDIVLVTFNYRLGVFGFLTTYDAAAPGNSGLRDQVLLLQWVQDNIASFGGDPKAVTIFGESAGGVSVSLLVLSPLTKGLFHHAISQSGSALANFGASGRKMGFTDELAEKLGCPVANITEMVGCLTQVPSSQFLASASPFEHLYQPRVDVEVEHPFLPEDPRLLLERGDFNLVPWMQGVTEEEGWPFVPIFAVVESIFLGVMEGDTFSWGLMSDLTTRTASSILECDADPTAEATKVRDFYTDLVIADLNPFLLVARVISDRFFNAALLAESSLASRHTAVYQYMFEYKGPGRLFFSNISTLEVSNTDAGHGDELMYLFSQTELPLEKPGTPNHNMIRNMVSLWTSFARTGKPSSESSAAPDWPIFTEQSQRHMRLDSDLTVGEKLFEDRVKFWRTIAVNEPWRRPTGPDCERLDIRFSYAPLGEPIDDTLAFYNAMHQMFK
ncbi:juvenile hormone esterase-like [Amphibalanus amphitrite]|uniref:juvenile hormone esterase-like n=1 Tax=Amphibalanus amphitrite TaxID=1232801 RepID=UPI001C90D778|nr:juvenile hormone esterase-like [Amphibalanus amphitrite]